MNLAAAIEKAHLVLRTYDDCIYDKHAWADIVRTLLPVAEAAMRYHGCVHPFVCDEARAANFSETELERLEDLLRELCAATKMR